MGIENSKDVSDPRETLFLRMSLQVKLIERELGKEASEESKLAWVERNSKPFGEFFDARKNDFNFLERCKSDPDLILDEYSGISSHGEIDRAA